jgi:hypothetical protein
MKVFAIGIAKNSGISTKNSSKGKPYEMVALLILTAIEPGEGNSKDKKTGEETGGTWKREGYGFQVSEITVAKEAFESFKDVKFPCDLDVVTDTQPMFGRMNTVVVGIKVESKFKAAA